MDVPYWYGTCLVHEVTSQIPERIRLGYFLMAILLSENPDPFHLIQRVERHLCPLSSVLFPTVSLSPNPTLLRYVPVESDREETDMKIQSSSDYGITTV
jgi:hypothetical protein